jgi:hypothetical protein
LVLTPAGAPVTATDTAPVKLVRETVAVYETLAPCCTDADAVERARAIAGLAVTVRVTVAVRVSADGAVPRMVKE